MDIDKFLEKDIIEFLERKQGEREEKLAEIEEEKTEEEYSPEDYYQDRLQEALDNKEFTKAKSIFNEAQEELEKKKTNDERERFNLIIDNLYAKIQEFSKHEDKEVKEEEKRPQKKESEKKEDPKEKIRKEMQDSSMQIAQFLQKRDLISAMNQYKKMKAIFSKLPKEDVEEKEDIFNELISSYYQIKKAEERIRREKKEKEQTEENERKQLYSKTRQEALLISKKIKVFLEQRDFQKLIEEYKKLKELFERFPAKYREERKELYDSMMKIYGDIKLSGSMLEPKGKRKKKAKDKEIIKKIIDIRKIMKDAIALMKEKKVEDAELKLIEIKHSVEMLPDTDESKKEEFEHILDEINHRLNFLKQTMETR